MVEIVLILGSMLLVTTFHRRRCCSAGRGQRRLITINQFSLMILSQTRAIGLLVQFRGQTAAAFSLSTGWRVDCSTGVYVRVLSARSIFQVLTRALLSFQGTQAEMIQQSTWMEMIIGSFELWERVVIYGQFQPIDAGETDQERRKRRNNTFAKQPTEYIQEIGSKGQLLQIIRHRVKE